MGLDVGFFHGGEEVFGFQGHYDFFYHFIIKSEDAAYEDYDDFYVNSETLDHVHQRILQEIKLNNMSDKDILTEVPDNFWELDASDFALDKGETSWKELLCYYPAIIRLLQNAVRENGPLVCGYSC
ncbi:hypothetical protein FHS72_003304 [Loktanella ponticola]|uniref:DUF1877 family protein n=1 Tax=Yoonia ponticola TaxID=1524255 RepID=A0A7W9BP77_9RHOB|nr:hypothetical protein [Yoonia ponticola]MBB5723659.1 hypothetical protein [Yoonia ponticola]